uniref:TonB-dependent receptor domain-containing protein n=1 Tax=Thaumasiovibrio occultus TaxID=1891184 RepID=UPI000B3612B3|nr:TonB-dependent receptor [Thaumasiovibrio occultus]
MGLGSPAPRNVAFRLHTVSAAVIGLLASGYAVAETEDAAPVYVVIGEKTERSIFDTGSSVQVYDEETINSLPGATEIDDLLQLAPNVVDSGQGNDIPTIRGIDGSGPSVGGLASFAGSAPRLNLSIDGRSLTYSELAFGPRSLWDMQQAEIYLGPQSYIQGRSSSAGAIILKSNDPTYHFESAVKGGVAELGYTQTAAMISGPILDNQVAFRLSADQQKRDSHVEFTAFRPEGDPNEVEMTSVRGKILIEPAALPDLSTMIAISHMGSKSPQTEYLNTVGTEAFRPFYHTDTTSVTWDVSWLLTDTLTFENNLVYSDYSVDRYTYQNPRQGDFTIDGKDFHIEPLMRYQSLNGAVQGLFGLRYFKSSQDEAYIGYTATDPMSGSTETASVFAEVTYAVTPIIDLTFAGRYDKERVKRQAEIASYRFDLDHKETLSVFLPKFEIALKPSANNTLGFRIGKGYNSDGAGLSFNSNQFTGFTPYTYDEEYVWNYELFARSRQGNVDLIANAFYNDFDGLQIMQVLPDGEVMIANVDQAKTYGAELGVHWYATTDLMLFTNIGVLETEFTEPGGQKRDLPRAPASTVSVGGTYTFFDNFELSANTSYTGGYYTDRDNTAAGEVGAYTVTNAQLAYVFNNGRVNVYATNLFDADNTTMWYPGGEDDRLILVPRQVGASLQLDF